ncbi:hypothetical protein CR513_06033, partial [Mucuna pruriens]
MSMHGLEYCFRTLGLHLDVLFLLNWFVIHVTQIEAPPLIFCTPILAASLTLAKPPSAPEFLFLRVLLWDLVPSSSIAPIPPAPH